MHPSCYSIGTHGRIDEVIHIEICFLLRRHPADLRGLGMPNVFIRPVFAVHDLHVYLSRKAECPI